MCQNSQQCRISKISWGNTPRPRFKSRGQYRKGKVRERKGEGEEGEGE